MVQRTGAFDDMAQVALAALGRRVQLAHAALCVWIVLRYLKWKHVSTSTRTVQRTGVLDGTAQVALAALGRRLQLAHAALCVWIVLRYLKWNHVHAFKFGRKGHHGQHTN